jgi:excisionase family DNA binding protein
MPPNASKTLGTLQDAAAYLQISERSAYTFAREGSLPGAVKVGKKVWRVDMDALRAWVKAEGHPAPRSSGAAELQSQVSRHQ